MENQEKNQDNIVKKVCKELGITQKELAQMIGVSQGMPAKWAMDNKPPHWATISMNLILENKELKNKMAKLKDFQTLILGDL